MPKPADWRFPEWKDQGDDTWHLIQGPNGDLVGEVYRRDENVIKWHCKTSDWRDINAESIEQAKAECECSFWKEEWYRAVEGKGKYALTQEPT